MGIESCKRKKECLLEMDGVMEAQYLNKLLFEIQLCYSVMLHSSNHHKSLPFIFISLRSLPFI